MPCCLGLAALFFPRIVLVLVVLFSDWLGEAFRSNLWPFLGFLFLPLTTLAYAWAIHARGSVEGFHLAMVVLAVLIDLGIVGGGAAARRRSRKE